MATTKQIIKDIDYLVPLISYLGSNPYWWARSAPSLAKEISLDPMRVQEVFNRYPMIFRKSLYIEDSDAFSYALQMRYAHRKDGGLEEPGKVSFLPVLSEAEIISLVDFLMRISSEVTSKRNTTVAIIAAVVSALTALIVAFLK